MLRARRIQRRKKGTLLWARKTREMRFCSFMQTPASLSRKMLLQITHQVTKKSGAARMKFILSGTASVAMKWMIGSKPKRNLEET